MQSQFGILFPNIENESLIELIEKRLIEFKNKSIDSILAVISSQSN